MLPILFHDCVSGVVLGVLGDTKEQYKGMIVSLLFLKGDESCNV